MEEKKHFDDTISNMSLDDILDEIKASDYDDEDVGAGVEEIIAEFADASKKSIGRKPLSNQDEDEIVLIYQKPTVRKENKADSEGKTLPESLPVFKSKEKTSCEDVKAHALEDTDMKTAAEPKKIEKVVRPWQDGVYGDMEIKEEQPKKEKPKKMKPSRLAETFDTLTRSELFEDKGKDEKEEARSVEEIIKENTKLSRLLGIRCIVLLILSLAFCYLAFAEPLGWYFPQILSYTSHPFRYLFLTVFLQTMAMLLSVDVISRGLAKLFKLRADFESAVAFSCFATLVHPISVMALPKCYGWLPYGVISVLSLLFTLYGKWLESRAVCRVCKIAKASKKPELIFSQKSEDKVNIIKQSSDDKSPFTSKINTKDASKTFWTFLSPIIIVSSLVFAMISSLGTHTPKNFFWALAAVSSVSVPFFSALSFSLPFSVTAKSLASVGAAISGWFSASRLSQKANVVVGDEDLFPKGTVTIHGLKILGEYSLEKTISYTASVIGMTKSGLTGVFADLLKSRYGVTTEVRNLRYHESGGIEAEVGKDSVLIGSAGFILRSGVRLSSGLNTKNTVFIAINRQPAGLFNINYKANIDVERALHMLVRKRIPVVLAVRDFNLLPMMVEQAFDLKDGTLDYPEIEQRLDLSSDEQFVDGEACALITRRGLYPLASAVLAAKKLRRATIRNICLATISSLLGMLFMFYMTFTQRPALITPHTVFVYMLLWCVSSFLLSMRVKK